jgi:hypothetical protein
MTDTSDSSESPYATTRTLAIDQGFRTLRTLIWALTVAFIFYTASRSVEALAGHDTKLSVALSVIFDALVDLKFVFAISLAGAGVAWGVIERAVRLRKVDYMQGRIKELEERIDPNRTSSGLTTRGTTNPRDRFR